MSVIEFARNEVHRATSVADAVHAEFKRLCDGLASLQEAARRRRLLELSHQYGPRLDAAEAEVERAFAQAASMRVSPAAFAQPRRAWTGDPSKREELKAALAAKLALPGGVNIGLKDEFATAKAAAKLGEMAGVEALEDMLPTFLDAARAALTLESTSVAVLSAYYGIAEGLAELRKDQQSEKAGQSAAFSAGAEDDRKKREEIRMIAVRAQSFDAWGIRL